MGWGVGMGIGWSTTPSGGLDSPFIIQSCGGGTKLVYSISSQFSPGAYVYTDSELTTPFTDPGYWNLPELINTVGGYELSNTTGQVKNPLTVCPV